MLEGVQARQALSLLSLHPAPLIFLRVAVWGLPGEPRAAAAGI
mgnify:FL=1